MSRYRKIDPRIWNDAKFRSMTDQGKLAFLFLLTHPHMTALGAMRASLPGLAAEIGWPPEAFAEAFDEAKTKGMSEHDEDASMVWLPNFLKYNPPESPNVVKAWVHSLDLLPECCLLYRVIAGAKAFAETMNKGFAEALPEAFAKSMANQEQEQEQEQEQDKNPAAGAAPGAQEAKPKPPKFDPLAMQLPECIPAQAWAEWIAYRRARKLSTTEQTAKAQATKLQQWAAKGHSPGAIIADSITNGWQGLFEPKGMPGSGGMTYGDKQAHTFAVLTGRAPATPPGPPTTKEPEQGALIEGEAHRVGG